jgi:hypothetical protein
MPTQASKVHYDIAPREVRQVAMDVAAANIQEAMQMGFGISNSVARDMANMYGFGADSVQGLVTQAAIPNLIQFLQNWLPGQVYVMTAAREIDNLIGITTQGEFSDEQIVQEVLEMVGYAVPYSDYGNAPLADWNLNFVPRTNIRFELGMRVGILEEERAARQRVNSAQSKRESCGLNLEITRNLVGFNGYNSGNDLTYGFLNDPGLASYITVANGASGLPEWSSKTFLEICADIRAGFVQIRTQSKGVINPANVDTVLALPTNAIDYLTVTSDFGISVRQWLRETYPRCRIQDAIQLNTANGSTVGSGAFYLYAERVTDLSTDDGKVWVQVVPQKFRVLGVQKLTKSYQEDYANATCGAMLKRPFAVVRYVGIS